MLAFLSAPCPASSRTSRRSHLFRPPNLRRHRHRCNHSHRNPVVVFDGMRSYFSDAECCGWADGALRWCCCWATGRLQFRAALAHAVLCDDYCWLRRAMLLLGRRHLRGNWPAGSLLATRLPGCLLRNCSRRYCSDQHSPTHSHPHHPPLQTSPSTSGNSQYDSFPSHRLLHSLISELERLTLTISI